MRSSIPCKFKYALQAQARAYFELSPTSSCKHADSVLQTQGTACWHQAALALLPSRVARWLAPEVARTLPTRSSPFTTSSVTLPIMYAK